MECRAGSEAEPSATLPFFLGRVGRAAAMTREPLEILGVKPNCDATQGGLSLWICWRRLSRPRRSCLT